MSSETLPPNWSWVNAENICERVTDGTHDTPKYFAHGIPLITSKNLKNSSIDFENINYISTEDHKNIKKRSGVDNGDILFAMIGTIGNPVLVDSKIEFSIKNIGLFKKNESKIISKYLQLWLSSYQLQKLLEEKEFIKGTTQKFIPLKNLRKLPIPLPSLPEQKKIVEKIEELFSGLDSGVASLKKAKKQIRLYRQSVLASAFSGKLLTPSAQRQAHSELPDGWKWVKLGEIISPSKARFEPLQNDNVKYIGLEHIEKGTGFILSYADSNTVRSTKSVFKKGNLLYGKLRPYLNKIAIAEFDGVCSTDILVFENQSKLSNKFIKYRLLCEDYVNYAQKNMKGVQHPRINFMSISEFEISLPPLTQQTQIVEEIEKRFSEADNLEKAIDDSLVKSETLRQSILKQAFEGRLV